MAKGDAVQEVVDNKKSLKQRWDEKLNSDNISGSIEKDAKIGALFGTALIFTIGGIAVVNSIKTQRALSILEHTLVSKAQQVSSFDAQYVAYFPDMTCVGGIAELNQKEVEGYFTIDKGIAIDKADQCTYGTIRSITYDAISKVSEVANTGTVTFTEGKLADKVDEYNNVM